LVPQFLSAITEKPVEEPVAKVEKKEAKTAEKETAPA
jgi:hypothetical protein